MKKVMGIFFVLGITLLVSGCSELSKDNATKVEVAENYSLTQSGVTTKVSEDQKAQLQHLIQEEKLARDVYLEMYKLRGHKKFYNIINSEENHQAQLAGILKLYAIDNPVQEMDSGVFRDDEFKSLYDKLITKGSISLAKSFEAGVDIETMDIKDIELMMPAFSDRADIQVVLQKLLDGSKRHLVAFSK